MKTITDDQIAEIEALAGRATPGPWALTLDRDLSVASSEWGLFDVRQDQPNFVVDAHYAATANPTIVHGLITRLREAERDAARYLWMLKHYGEFHGERTLAALALQHGSLDAAIDAAMLSAREAAE